MLQSTITVGLVELGESFRKLKPPSPIPKCNSQNWEQANVQLGGEANWGTSIEEYSAVKWLLT